MTQESFNQQDVPAVRSASAPEHNEDGTRAYDPTTPVEPTPVPADQIAHAPTDARPADEDAERNDVPQLGTDF